MAETQNTQKNQRGLNPEHLEHLLTLETEELTQMLTDLYAKWEQLPKKDFEDLTTEDHEERLDIMLEEMHLKLAISDDPRGNAAKLAQKVVESLEEQRGNAQIIKRRLIKEQGYIREKLAELDQKKPTKESTE